MNPQFPQQPPSPEQAPQPGAQFPEQMPVVPEAPAPSNAAPANSGAPLPPKLSPADVAAAIAQTPTPQAPTPAAAIPTPSTAADQDLIEPEWVNKAEQVVTQTAGNPYAEEEAVEDLQVDYLKKRYGHEVKKPEDK